MTKRACIITFGCQMNKLDSQIMSGSLSRAGYELVRDAATADVVIFNTCSVREHAEDKVFSYLGHIARHKAERPDMIVVVAGCMAQRLKDALFRTLPCVDLVVGTGRLAELVDLIDEARTRTVVATEGSGSRTASRDPHFRSGRFQAYVAAMRGCDNSCSYCVVPFVRGREVSRPVGEITDEVKSLVDDGVVEVTLLGQNVSSYGKGKPFDLADLLEAVNGVSGLERIRFVTCHPRDVTRRLLEAVADLSKVCEHLHVPAQSGSDRVLARMKRGYTRSEYLELVATARELIPRVTIASDFIVGFPGESVSDFDETLSLVQTAGFSNVFAFKYSPRPGTAAARMEDDVPIAEKKRRNAELLAAQAAVSRARKRSRLGAVEDVLVEGTSPRDPAKMVGRTRGFEIVVFEAPPALEGKVVRVTLQNATELVYFGQLVEVPTNEVSAV